MRGTVTNQATKPPGINFVRWWRSEASGTRLEAPRVASISRPYQFTPDLLHKLSKPNSPKSSVEKVQLDRGRQIPGDRRSARGDRAQERRMIRVFDPYALALSCLVGGVGFGMTFFFNTNVAEWGADEIAYPSMAMVYVYARNARFFASDDKANDELLEGNTAANRGSTSGVAGSASASIKVQVPSTTESPGLTLVIGNPFPTPTEGSYAVVFFFATWCSNCERCLPAFLALASRYSDEGVAFAGVTQEPEDDLRYFSETYKRSLREVSLFADKSGAFTKAYQGAHQTKTIPHCYIVRGNGKEEKLGTVQWDGHPTRLESALAYLLDLEDERADGDS